MACNFQLGETVQLSIVITDQDDAPFDPATVTVTIYNEAGAAIETDQVMINDGVGLYHHNFNSTTSNPPGLYTACYKATDAPTITILPDKFRMVTCP